VSVVPNTINKEANNSMSKKSNPTNRFTEEALQYVQEIGTLRSVYETAKQSHAQSRELLAQAEADIIEILNDRDSDVSDCAERLVLAQAKLDVLKHRLSSSGDNSVAATLIELATVVDASEGFTMGASNYIAKTVRHRKVQELALELGMNPGHIDTNDISIRRHPKAIAAEHLAVTTKLANFVDLEKISEVTALQHVGMVLTKLHRLAEFEFQDPSDSRFRTKDHASDSAV
jgi:hypothetical protein